MTDYEVYDRFFADEEYDLKNTSGYEYSYWGGWNSALKRASILVRDEIRPQGRWVFKDLHNGKIWYECSICGRKIHIRDKVQLSDFPFCHCGAKMRGDENDK